MEVFSRGSLGTAKSSAALGRWWDQVNPWAVTLSLEGQASGSEAVSCIRDTLLHLDKGLAMAFLLLAHRENKCFSGNEADSPSGCRGQLQL